MIPQQWQICLTAVRESRKEDHAVASRCAGRRAKRRSPSIRSTVAAIRLIVQLKTGVTFTFIRLLAVSNQPVLQPNPRSAIKCCGLATVSNDGVPASTTQDGDSRPMRISTGVNSHSNSGISSYSFASASSRMPSSSTFCAPLPFLSCTVPHSGQRQRGLRPSPTAFSTCPHSEQV